MGFGPGNVDRGALVGARTSAYPSSSLLLQFPARQQPPSLSGVPSVHQADRLKGALSLPGLLASLSPQVASAQADAGFALT